MFFLRWIAEFADVRDHGEVAGLNSTTGHWNVLGHPFLHRFNGGFYFLFLDFHRHPFDLETAVV